MENEILNLAEKYGINLKKSSIDAINMGLDFQVLIGEDIKGQEWVLRIPRRTEVFEKAQTEKKILELVNDLNGVFQVPYWEIFTEELIAYKKLDGVPAVTTDIETQETNWVFDETNVPETYTKSLGKALASLHAIPKEKAEAAGIPVETGTNLRESMRDRMVRVKDQYEINPALWKRWQDWLDNEGIWPTETGFIHGDLFPGHTLVNSTHRITGIIDWTEAKVSDTANDFTAFYMLFGEEYLEELIQAYAQAGGFTWPKMKDHIIELLSIQGITLAEFAWTSGLEEYNQMAAEILKDGLQ